jgi:hypothetical protein
MKSVCSEVKLRIRQEKLNSFLKMATRWNPFTGVVPVWRVPPLHVLLWHGTEKHTQFWFGKRSFCKNRNSVAGGEWVHKAGCRPRQTFAVVLTPLYLYPDCTETPLI